MRQHTVRWLLLALASGAIMYVVLRRRQQIMAALPEPLAEQIEHFVIPWPSSDPPPVASTEVATTAAPATPDDEAPDEEPEGEDDRRRKVSSNYRISYLGRRYGPLPQTLVGQYVDVETRDNKLFILHDDTPIATFDLSS